MKTTTQTVHRTTGRTPRPSRPGLIRCPLPPRKALRALIDFLETVPNEAPGEQRLLRWLRQVMKRMESTLQSKRQKRRQTGRNA